MKCSRYFCCSVLLHGKKQDKTDKKQLINIFDEGTISDSDLRMLIDKIEISEKDGKLDINITLNGRFKEHTKF